MDCRVRIAILAVTFLFSVEGFRSVEEVPPPLLRDARTRVEKTVAPLKRSATSIEKPAILSLNGTTSSGVSEMAAEAQRNHSIRSENPEQMNSSVPVTVVYRTRNITSPSVAAPEFEDRNEQDEGGKGEEDPDAHADEAANAVPPVDDEAAGEGIAKEDTEPVKGKDKEENQLGAMVEDAKGNVPVPPTPNKLQTRVDFNQSEDSHFMTFVMVGGLLVFCLYLLHYNKKKILGLVFEGRAPGRHRRNVRYRRLSQRDEHDKEDVIY